MYYLPIYAFRNQPHRPSARPLVSGGSVSRLAEISQRCWSQIIDTRDTPPLQNFETKSKMARERIATRRRS